MTNKPEEPEENLDRQLVVKQKEEKEDEEVEVGELCEMKQLFADGKSACSCCTSWTDKEPFLKSKHGSDKDAKYAAYAVLRRCQPHGNSWKTESIIINSPKIKTSLAEIFRDYPLDVLAPDLSFKPPFLPLIHRWKKLVEYEEGCTDPVAKAHLGLLRQALEPELRGSLDQMESFEKAGYATFQMIPFIFLPGEILITSSDGVLSAGIMRTVTHRKSYRTNTEWYELELNVVDWDGERCGVANVSWTLDHFEGSQPLTTLDVFPLRVHGERKAIEARLVKRGRVWEALRGQHFKHFSGSATYISEEENSFWGPRAKTRPINERVIIDTYGYYNLQEKCPPKLDPLDTLESVIRPSHGLWDEDSVSSGDHKSDGKDPKALETLSDSQLLLAVSTVKGFALDSKAWCDFEVTGFRDIDFKEHSIDMLVLSPDEKRLIVGFLASHEMQNEEDFDDFIPGKGKGIVMLLSGPPGVGKTLTAESVSEHLKRPLYRLNMSDLGSTASTVEPRLKRALVRCSHWNAVLLLDEADVFLEERSTNSLERNELVSIFLRLLEYYEGVMMLTTNRVKAIDSAFESRIDVILAYNDLTEDGRAKVWRNFLGKIPNHSLDDEAVTMLAKTQLNGRQIKSAVKTARILASTEGQPLNAGHIQTVMGLRRKAEVLLGSSVQGTKKRGRGWKVTRRKQKGA
ncbi:P-loop containing nucleoside triphosphate hydrolase protein [Echria macrotheca]|uniref:P-loop containing nucleoside triphosphate hydrolase protein n=1 Tax=Echria macrotheca TaxID=438768 RepID=A0AAJ0B462_9PEZI|nr:P-loop containing nucleoside triphosphate hydrolase protein [Echria macrotheca]